MKPRLEAVILAISCLCLSAEAGPADFEIPRLVSITGYEDHAMEPFLSRDGQYLYFNSRNEPGDETDLHVAKRINDLDFAYIGPVEGANSDALDAVPSLDKYGNFYFVSSRSYEDSRNMLWRGRLENSEIVDVRQVDGEASRFKPLWLNMDVEISANGNTLYITENQWKIFGGGLKSSNIFAMKQTSSGEFVRDKELDALFSNINTDDLEYAPNLSADELTLYFTRAEPDKFKSAPNAAYGLYVATRKSVNDPFGKPKRIRDIQGYVEAPSITPDNCGLYFHQKVKEAFRILFVERSDCQSIWGP